MLVRLTVARLMRASVPRVEAVRAALGRHRHAPDNVNLEVIDKVVFINKVDALIEVAIVFVLLVLSCSDDPSAAAHALANHARAL